MDWDPQAAAPDGFICPPCPVFHPTHEQFRHPLKYISSIKHIGMQAGICKIVPPADWRPPFALNEKSFRFRTRVQQLNCIEAHSRAEGNFVEALRLFLYRHGSPMQELPRADDQLVNLLQLYSTVTELGGFQAVCDQCQWPQVVGRVGRTRGACKPSQELCRVYRQHYENTLLAYEEEQKSKHSDDQKMKIKSKSPVKSETTNTHATPSTSALNPGISAVGATSATPLSKPRSRSKMRGMSTSKVTDDEPMDSGDDNVSVKRTLFSEPEHTSSEENDGGVRTRRRPGSKKQAKHALDLSPEALKPSANRKERLGSPDIRAGQQFYQFFPETGAVLAEVKRVFGGKKPHVAVKYLSDGSSDDIELSTMEILIANGWDADAAELAFKSEICQACLRGDCWEQMLLCDGCNSGQHLFCLDKPLNEIPSGDWYCQACVDEAVDPGEREANPKFGFDMTAEINMVDYKERADAWKRNYFSLPPDADVDAVLSDSELEREYWRLLSIPVHEQRLEVQYGSDVDTGATGSGFPRIDSYLKNLRIVAKRWKNLTTRSQSDYTRQLSDFFSHGLRQGLAAAAGGENMAEDAAPSLEELLRRYAEDDWNLNNMPKLPGSVLQHLDEDIKGVMVPWLYTGMCFSTFCWHVEDHNFYSTSYLHCGAPKTWYGVPCDKAELMEATMKKLAPGLFGSQPDLHMQLVTMFSPKILREHGVPVYRATHHPNEFIVTFPSAYHAGFNNGFNCAEAVNFATVDWLPWGFRALHKYREYRKLPVFCHEALVHSLAETLVESNSFDAELATTYLVPAVQQLLDDYRVFQRRVGEATTAVARRELMADFEKRQYHGSSSNNSATDAPAASSRRSMVARACNKPVKDDKAISMKMRKPPASMGAARPSRMVLWAGQAGKSEGLRCAVCKQYCYLQAVVCTKCRPHHGAQGTVGCMEHYSSMCKCSLSDDHVVYLYRFEASRLEELLTAMNKRLDTVRDWELEFEATVDQKSAGSDKVKTKPSVQQLKLLLSSGKACGGAKQERLDALDFALSHAERWSQRAQDLLRTYSQEQAKRRKAKSWTQRIPPSQVTLRMLERLLEDADKLVAAPKALSAVQDVIREWHAARSTATDILNSMKAIQHHEAQASTTVNNSTSALTTALQALGVPSVIKQDNVRYGLLVKTIDSVGTNLQEMGECDAQDDLVDQLMGAQRYLEALCAVNDIAASIVLKADGDGDVKTESRTTEAEVQRILDAVDQLGLELSSSIARAEALQTLLEFTQTVSQEVTDAMDDRSKSTEELEVLLRRACAMPVLPTRTQELTDRLDKCKSWERRAQEILSVVTPVSSSSQADSNGQASSLTAWTQRPSLEDAERFCSQADAHFVPSSSLLRRQMHARVQDCRRWGEAVYALFLRPSNSQLPLAEFLQNALDKNSRKDEDSVHPHSKLHCVCQQVLSERAQLVTCSRCQQYFHPQCVRGLLPQRARESFVCAACSPRRAVVGSADQQEQLFCLCRGPEVAPMICCDFCDEWYHGACVELSPQELDRIEAFRCPRCSRQQQLYYLDKKLLRRECWGRRPALTRVESFLSQLQTHLVAQPAGARELEAYLNLVRRVEGDADAFVARFAAQEFSASAFATPGYGSQQEREVVRLLERVTDLEVALEATQARLIAVHWCLRACQLVLGPCDRAPKYAHLAALLQDARSQPELPFPREEYRLMQLTIADRVDKAARWLHSAKTLEVEEWNVHKARRLRREFQELEAFLELPAVEVELVHTVAANNSNEEGNAGGTYGQDEQVESPSAVALKKRRIW